MAGDERHLGDSGFDPSVNGGNAQNMATREAGTPDSDTAAIYVPSSCRVRDGMPEITDLPDRVDLLARLAVAGAEVAVVIDQYVKACGSEYLRELFQMHLFDRRHPVHHYHHRARGVGLFRLKEPTAQSGSVSIEFNILARHPRSHPVAFGFCADSFSRSGRPPTTCLATLTGAHALEHGIVVTVVGTGLPGLHHQS